MPTYLLKWDATRWDWRNLREQSEAALSGVPVVRTWPCGSSRRIFPGDRVFILRSGREPRGIVASGSVTRGSYDSPQNEAQDGSRARGTLSVDVKLDAIVEPRQEAGITRAALGQGAFGAFNWDVAASGTAIPDMIAGALEAAWRSRGTGGAGSQAHQDAAADRLTEDRAEAGRAVDQKLEDERLAQELVEADRKQRTDEERLAKERAAADRKQRAEEERLAKDRAESDRKLRAEEERLAKQRAESDSKRRAEEERLAKERAEGERKLRAEQERLAKDRAEAERKQQAEAERVAKERAKAAALAAAPRPASAAPSPAAVSARGPSAPTPAMYPAVVTDYLDMLAAELRGEMYSKADHRNRLAKELGVEDADIIDVAFQQVSAVMLALGLPVVDGFRPLGGYPTALATAVHEHLETNPDLVEALWIGGDAHKVTVPVELDDSRMVLNPTPLAGEHDEGPSVAWAPRVALDVDFRAREARDEALATAGQRFVLAYERARLRETGMKDRVAKLEWVAQDRGDALGYHVRSFDEQGQPRYIIVKCTNFGARLPFTLSAAELAVGLEFGAQTCLYRVFAFSRGARLFVLNGPFEGRLTLVPLEFKASL